MPDQEPTPATGGFSGAAGVVVPNTDAEPTSDTKPKKGKEE